MLLIRRIGAVMLVVAAVIVIFAFKPDDPDHSAARDDISSTASLNNASAEGAPQQAVVNGWEHSDYLKLISRQLDESSTARARDDRPLLLLALCVAGIALIAFTTTPSSPSPPPAPAAIQGAFRSPADAAPMTHVGPSSSTLERDASADPGGPDRAD